VPAAAEEELCHFAYVDFAVCAEAECFLARYVDEKIDIGVLRQKVVADDAYVADIVGQNALFT